MLSRFLQEWRSYPQLTPLLLILLGIPLAFYSATASMAHVWLINETFTHGFLILPISLWLIWDQRQNIQSIAMHRDFRAGLLILPVLMLWLLATFIGAAVIQQLAVVALFPLTVWLILGLPLTLALLFPLLYLFFLVPLGQNLIPPMMELTADATVYLVQISGIPIFRDGLSFQLPTGNWSVVEECSGVRYLIASAALGTIYAYITYESLTKRTVFIIASLIVPIVANSLRAYGIVMIGHLSGMTYAVGADHLLYGWVFFGIVIFVLFWVGGFWADAGRSKKSGDKATTARPSPPKALLGLAVAVAFLSLNLGIQALIQAWNSPFTADTELTLPQTAGNWEQVSTDVHGWSPILNNPDRTLAINYRPDGTSNTGVTLHLAYFHAQRDGAEAISSLNRLTDPYSGDWKLTASRSFESSRGHVDESEVNDGRGKVLVWSTYLVGNQFVAHSYKAKLYQIQGLLVGNRQASFITLSTPFDAPLPALRERLDAAWQDLSTPVRDVTNAFYAAH